MNVQVYEHTPEQDILLGQWYMEMMKEGELERTFTRDARAVSAFYGIFRAPNTLTFVTDDRGIWLAAWFEPMMDGTFMGLWVRRDMRGTKTALRTLVWLLERALKEYPLVMGVTKQQRIVAEHMRLGYNMCGILPRLYDGEDAYLLVLTQKNLHKSGVYKRLTRQKEKVM